MGYVPGLLTCSLKGNPMRTLFSFLCILALAIPAPAHEHGHGHGGGVRIHVGFPYYVPPIVYPAPQPVYVVPATVPAAPVVLVAPTPAPAVVVDPGSQIAVRVGLFRWLNVQVNVPK